MQVGGLGAVSDAPVERVRWENPLVIWELAVLFGENKKARDDYLTNWAEKAKKEIVAKTRVFKNGRRASFWEKILLLLL